MASLPLSALRDFSSCWVVDLFPDEDVVFSPSSASCPQGTGERVAKGLPEHGAGEDVDNGSMAEFRKFSPKDTMVSWVKV